MDPNCWEMLLLPPQAQELLRFACTRMVHSYKPVLVGIFLDRLPLLTFPFSDVARDFVAFYRDREAKGLPVERRSAGFVVNGGVDGDQCAATAGKIIREVFQPSRSYAALAGGEVRLGPPRLWRMLGDGEVRDIARRLLGRALDEFYERIATLGEAVHGRMDPTCAAQAHELVLSLSDTDDGDDLFGLRAGD